MELKGENAFKIKAYSNGAEAIESQVEDLGRLVDEKRLTEIRSIGAALAAKIAELHLTGRCEYLERLRSELPPGVVELSAVPGLTVKRIQALHSALAIASIAELQAACESGLVAAVPGFGKKTEEKILQGIKQHADKENRLLLVEARPLAERIQAHLHGAAGLSACQIAGSIRRWVDSAGDINLAGTASDNAAVLQAFQRFPPITKVEESNHNSARVRFSSGLTATLLLADAQHFIPALIWATGSSAHVDRLIRIAQERGLSYDEKGLFQGAKELAVETEADFYRHLGMSYIPPELREDEGEIEAAQSQESFDDLIQVEDIRGMVHCHTTYSDGRNSIEEMALAAQEMGIDYITITDHSPTAHYANGVTADKLKKQWEEIERVQEKVGVKLLRGTESDILEDGSLDYPDDILDKFDVIVGSIHSRMRMDSAQMTRRLVNCMRNPHFKIWGHALGRLVLKRPPIDCQVEEVLDAAAESRVAVEVNGDPYRLDMEPKWLRQARKRGIKFVISVDAHSIADLYNLPFGVHTARRAGIRRSEVLNTLTADAFRQAVKP